MMTRVYEQAARVLNEQINHGSGWNAQFFDQTKSPPLLVANHVQPKCHDNIQGAIVLCTFTGATPITIQHNLGYIPRCYIPIWKSAPCDVYDDVASGPNYVPPGLGLVLSAAATRPDGTSPYTTVTTSTIPLRSTAAATVLLLIF